MSKEIYISSTPHETRLAIVENDALTEIYYERENEYTLAGSIYNGKVTRVLPGMQSSFVDIGLERDAFLYITDFMEEAGDSADFDTNGDSGRRSEGRRSDRGDRNGSPTTIEGTIASPPDRLDQTSDSGVRSSERTDRGDRGGRSDRGRGGRGRRDRGGNRDRQPIADPLAPASPDDSFNAPVTDFFSADQPTENLTDRNDAGEIGEGAPGADGSRRWRGRRGRRRGRGPGQRDESPNVAGATPENASGEAVYDEDSFDIDGAAAPIAPANSTTAPIASAYGAPETSTSSPENLDRGNRDRGNERGARNDRGGRSRGGRNDRDDRGNRGDRGDRGGRDREPRVPRGFAPKTALYGVDDAPAYDQAPELDANAPEPIVLPGESLSKYRKGGEEPVAAASKPAETNVIIPSAPEFSIPEGWDGGSILPGESLSRHRRNEPRTESRNQPRAEHRQEARADYRNASPAPSLPRAEVIREADGFSVGETIVTETKEQPEVLLATHPDLISHEQLQHETPAEPVEYEPTDASASYRIDPAAPSEYRQSAPVLDAPEEVHAETHGEPQAHDHSAEHSAAHSITPAPDEHVAQLRTEPAHTAYEPFDWQTPAATPFEPASAHVERAVLAEAAPAPHELTTLHATGEMHSEAPVAIFTPEHATETVSPIEHETAVANPADNVVADQAAPQHFSPGIGSLEEETLDEEDFNATLHASSIEEMDDFEEEETLEGAADLGTMIREMSIDQITRSGNVDEDEEDDLEEEDAIYDPLVGDLEDTDEEDLDESDTEEDVLHEEFVEGDEVAANGFDQAQAGAPAPATDRNRDQDRGRGRRDGRRDGRRGDRYGRSDRNDRPRNTGGAGDRERSSSGRDRRGGRSSMQSTNLPAISELLKPGQEILVQIAKEPIAKKGARITSHIALPGRFLVFMPTVNHTGVSRKIDSDSERRRLKEILLSEKGDAAGGFIVRTAASGASEEELRSDLRFLLNLWADIKQRSESSKSPALIYHDLNLVERILRDQVTDNFSAIWVDSESEYERVLRFLQRFQPSLIRRVKLYTKETPLFEQFGITEEINKALRSKVWLKSGGSIVINQTEALVAIDINTGKFVGKTARLEDTIVKTNLDAIPEIVRQIRLRDLGGIIIIDFIDMDERKNRNKVMAALEEELKTDRAPSKVLQFNDFGLVAITRKRVKQSLERTLSTTCNICTGTGMVKSPVTVCNDIYIEMRKMQKHLDRGDVMLRVNPEVVKQLKAPGTKWLQEMEEMVGKTILVKSDPSLHPEQFDIH
ncbi:Rne/Rng family ribonuclease [Tunturibacter empetritectus]|uniref:Ribonuclease G n=1 Tax=Tunturiibacter empetritectus TaxID=3069691 RepID=A0A7W8MSR4_9BACT|nr:Rne/Rng family ribonuclease [Edaphobacter lichenicola]MBB5318973.1 ribonuclease G [Edaphobacter lichenicola]